MRNADGCTLLADEPGCHTDAHKLRLVVRQHASAVSFQSHSTTDPSSASVVEVRVGDEVIAMPARDIRIGTQISTVVVDLAEESGGLEDVTGATLIERA